MNTRDKKIPDEEIEFRNGQLCYVGNKVAQYIFEEYGIDLDKIAKLTDRGVLPLADTQQFYRLLGYSVTEYQEIFDNIDDDIQPMDSRRRRPPSKSAFWGDVFQ